MQQQEIASIKSDYEVQGLYYKALDAGIPRSEVDAVIDRTLGDINPITSIAIKMTLSALLALLKDHEQKRTPKTFFGRLLKAIFG